MQYGYIKLLALLSLRELYGSTAEYWRQVSSSLDAPRDAPRGHVLINILVIQLQYQYIYYISYYR